MKYCSISNMIIITFLSLVWLSTVSILSPRKCDIFTINQLSGISHLVWEQSQTLWHFTVQQLTTSFHVWELTTVISDVYINIHHHHQQPHTAHNTNCQKCQYFPLVLVCATTPLWNCVWISSYYIQIYRFGNNTVHCTVITYLLFWWLILRL